MIQDPNFIGKPIHHSKQLLIADLKTKCGQLSNSIMFARFPGSQPVSLLQKHLQKLKKEDFYVCEKTDGVRYLLMIHKHSHSTTSSGNIFLIDRKYNFIPVRGLKHIFEDKKLLQLVNNSLLDGELVIDEVEVEEGDTDELTQQQQQQQAEGETGVELEGVSRAGKKVRKQAIFLVFDCISIRDTFVGNLNLCDRLKVAQGEFIFPVQTAIRRQLEAGDKSSSQPVEANTLSADTIPFYFGLKQMYRKEDVAFVLERVLPHLNHENDGLIFTQNNLPFVIGTCEGILKWKPKRLNSIDFLLEVEWLYTTEAASEETMKKGKEHIFTFDDEKLASLPLSAAAGSEAPENDWKITYGDIVNQQRMEVESKAEKRVKKCRYAKLSCSQRGTPMTYGYIYLDEPTHEKFYAEHKGKPIVVECCFDDTKPGLLLTDENNSKVDSWTEVRFCKGPGWRILRIRDDKALGNDIRTVKNVIKSISANIEEVDLKQLLGKPIKKFSF